MALDTLTSSVIDAYAPREAPACWEEVGPLVKSVVTATAERVPYSVEDLLHVVARLALWAEGRGVAREPAAWLKNETIDAFVLTGCAGLKPGTLRTYRTWLRRVRDVLIWDDTAQSEGLRLSAPPEPAPPLGRALTPGPTAPRRSALRPIPASTPASTSRAPWSPPTSPRAPTAAQYGFWKTPSPAASA